MTVQDCVGCGKPAPAEWCWEGRLDCPCDKPPHHLSTIALWHHLRELERRVAALEPRPDLRAKFEEGRHRDT
jgi:hypothetical protein